MLQTLQGVDGALPLLSREFGDAYGVAALGDEGEIRHVVIDGDDEAIEAANGEPDPADQPDQAAQAEPAPKPARSGPPKRGWWRKRGDESEEQAS